MMKNKKLWIAVGVVAVAVVAYLLLSGGKKEEKVEFETAKVEQGNIQTSITATGTIEPVTSVTVGTQVSGIVSKLYVDYNSVVKKGQVIAELDKTNLISELNTAKANLSSAQSTATYELSNYNRYKTLYDKGLVSADDYAVMEDYTRKLFARGQETAAKHGLILVDTKYEFGKRDGKVYLIDEIHTPDSSRYFYADGYEENLEKGLPQRQLSKEFVRQWLIDHDFMNEPGQTMPEITDEYAASVSDRYIELYEHITGEKFIKTDDEGELLARIERNVSDYLASIKK